MPQRVQRTKLGSLVAHRRAELGLSQEEVSQRVGMSQEWTSMVERGRIRQPRVGTLQRLAKVLDLPIEDLVIATGYSATRAGARALVPERIDDPELAASFLALEALDADKLRQARAMIEGLRLLQDAEFQRPAPAGPGAGDAGVDPDGAGEPDREL